MQLQDLRYGGRWTHGDGESGIHPQAMWRKPSTFTIFVCPCETQVLTQKGPNRSVRCKKCTKISNNKIKQGGSYGLNIGGARPP